MHPFSVTLLKSVTKQTEFSKLVAHCADVTLVQFDGIIVLETFD